MNIPFVREEKARQRLMEEVTDSWRQQNLDRLNQGGSNVHMKEGIGFGNFDRFRMRM